MDYIQLQKKFKRGPAVIIPKDIAIIIANTNLDKSSIVLDAGSGSGFLTCFLARFVKKVYSYDNRKEFLEISKSNAASLGLKNITFKLGDVHETIKILKEQKRKPTLQHTCSLLTAKDKIAKTNAQSAILQQN